MAKNKKGYQSKTDILRKERYQEARRLGFNSKDARIISKLSTVDYKKAINVKSIPLERSKSRIRYKDIAEADKHYLKKYAYKVSYHTSTRNPETGRLQKNEKQWITITSLNELTRSEVLKTAREYLQTDDAFEKYLDDGSRLAVSSIKLEVAYINYDLDI
jgi:hypothetical protein